MAKCRVKGTVVNKTAAKVHKTDVEKLVCGAIDVLIAYASI